MTIDIIAIYARDGNDSWLIDITIPELQANGLLTEKQAKVFSLVLDAKVQDAKIARDCMDVEAARASLKGSGPRPWDEVKKDLGY